MTRAYTRANSVGPWSMEREALARVLKAQGKSAAESAKLLNATFPALPKLTRNAVIAKWSRMGLCVKIDAREAPARKKQQSEAHARGDRKVKPAPKLHLDRTRIKGGQPSLRNVRFIARRADECAMFLANEEGPDGLVCGAPATHGAWCADCFKLVYPLAAQAAKRAA